MIKNSFLLCILTFVGFSLFQSCDEEIIFSSCNSLTSACSASPNVDYCLFGFKWGEPSISSESGALAQGPETGGGLLTYSFQSGGSTISTHRLNDVKTLDVDEKGECLRDNIHSAFAEYQSIGNISFEAIEDDSAADIKIFSYDRNTPNLGYPNYQDELCAELAGFLILDNDPITDCENFYSLCLHEIGHILGLGHVSTVNVMNPDLINRPFKELQEGDIEGIQSLYGN